MVGIELVIEWIEKRNGVYVFKRKGDTELLEQKYCNRRSGIQKYYKN